MSKEIEERLKLLRKNLAVEEKSCGKNTLYAQDLKISIGQYEESLKTGGYQIIGN